MYKQIQNLLYISDLTYLVINILRYYLTVNYFSVPNNYVL